MGICPKVDVLAHLEFESAYFKAAVQHFNLYATEDSYPQVDCFLELK